MPLPLLGAIISLVVWITFTFVVPLGPGGTAIHLLLGLSGALDCLDGYMKARLVTLLELHARALDPAVDTWHGGRFLERWADPGALLALEKAFAHYDLRDVARALWETIDLFQGLEEETARRLGLTAALDHAELRRRVAEVVPDPRGASTLWP